MQGAGATFFMNPGQRLRDERERLKLSHDAVAGALGISKRTLVNWENGHTPLKLTAAGPMDALGIDSSFVLSGKRTSAEPLMQELAPSVGAGLYGMDMHRPLVLGGDAAGAHQDYVVVPRYDVRVSAGKGVAEPGHEHELPLGAFAFALSWVQENLGRSGRGFCSVRVHGDSMQPTLLQGDEIIIDRQVQRVDVSGIYVIALRGDLLVKRVQRKLDGSLVVKSDNAAYEPEHITSDIAEEFRVVGRMVWPRVR
jgi:hypothetical protein